jgi:alcohol dehydrogenase class IV
MDVLCHALESYTARPYNAYERKEPEKRVAYCGSNPISDVWTTQALRLLSGAFRKAVLTGQDVQARTDMMQAATFAGMGFGNAGVHIPHACAYPIAGRVKEYVPAGYNTETPLVPHGQSVSLTAPAAFRFTYVADPERHEHAASLLDPRAAEEASAGREQLPAALTALMRDIGIPNGLTGVGYDESDIPGLVEGAMKQQRLLSISPRPVSEDDLDAVFRESLTNW